MKRINVLDGSSLLVGQVVMLLASIGCTQPQESASALDRKASLKPHGETSGQHRIFVHGATVFPEESLTDWISYSDHVSVVDVISEEEVPPEPSVIEHGEGYVGRKIVLRIADTLWSRAGAEPQSSEIEILALGWVVHDNHRAIAAVHGTPRIVVGGRYIMPLVKLRGAWAILTPASALAADEDPIADADTSENGQSRAARNVAGISSDALRGLLAASRPDSATAAYQHLPPEERVRMVRRVDSREAPPRPRKLPAEVARRIAPPHLVQALIE